MPKIIKDSNGEKHISYTKNLYAWTSIRDALEGSSAVKRANVLYLPIPQGFLDDPNNAASVTTNPSNNLLGLDPEYIDLIKSAPFYHANKPYMGYLQRARFPEIAINTLRGLVGVATRVRPEIELPKKIAYLEDSAMKDGSSLVELFCYCLQQVLSQGRISLVLDVNPKDNTFRIYAYESLNFVDWLEDDETGETVFAAFEEKVREVGEDKKRTGESVYRIIYTIENDPDSKGSKKVKTKKMLEGNVVEGSEVFPSLQGNKFEKIPILTIGSLKNQNDPSPIPLSGVSEIAYSIYRSSADMFQSQYMTCNPMFVISGASSSNGVAVSMGSTVALLLDNPDSEAYFTKTDTDGINIVKETINDLRREGEESGASIIGNSKMAEAAETTKIKQAARSATLVTVVENCAKGIEDILKLAAEISGANPEDVKFSSSTDFVERALSPQMLTALMGLWQNGAYSLESLLKVVRDAGYMIKGEDVEEEIKRIMSEGPTPGAATIEDEGKQIEETLETKPKKKEQPKKLNSKSRQRKKVKPKIQQTEEA